MKKFYGRIGYDNEGIVRQHEYKTLAEAEAYRRGALDMKEQCDITAGEGEMDNPLQDFWVTASDLESISEF